ncbi:DUF2325 domain-containing protein [Cupriavidus pauculus]|nr:DUF2325 domain-containing protein [Cupriavidus pauculus]
MQHPPFALARTSLLGTTIRHGDAPGCCTPHPVPTPAPATSAVRNVRHRTTLAELDATFHCSIIGTCLSTGELRKLVRRLIAMDATASDMEVHHEAVSLATRGGVGAKTLHKALDQRHALAIRQFASATDPDAVRAMWDTAQATGDIAGAYWATMTHPEGSVAVRQKAFGDVHMLSHLVGASNRADIRRLVALEAENETLKDTLARQQLRMQELGSEHAVAMQEASALIATLRGREQAPGEAVPADVTARQQLISAQVERIATAEARQALAAEAARTLRDDVAQLRAQLAASRAETQALEALVTRQQQEGREDDRASTLPALDNRSVLYIGGRPGTVTTIRTLVERAGGRFQDHDGGLEDRKGLLPAMVASADIVVFPVDCIDHDSVGMLKRICQKQGIDYHPVRSASVASFVELLARLP